MRYSYCVQMGLLQARLEQHMGTTSLNTVGYDCLQYLVLGLLPSKAREIFLDGFDEMFCLANWF